MTVCVSAAVFCLVFLVVCPGGDLVVGVMDTIVSV